MEQDETNANAYGRALVQLLADDPALAEAIRGNARFAELLWLMADKSNLFDATLALNQQLPDFERNLSDLRKAGSRMQRYAEKIGRLLEGDPKRRRARPRESALVN